MTDITALPNPPVSSPTSKRASLSVPTRVVTVLLGFTVALGLAQIVVALAQRALIHRLGLANSTVTAAEVDADNVRIGTTVVVGFVLLALTGAAFIWWCRRAHRAVEVRGGHQRYSEGWCIGGWFIPFVNFVIPKRIVDDIWVAVMPRRAVDRPAPTTLVTAWWTFWIGRLVLGIVSRSTGSNPASRVSAFEGNTLTIVAAAIDIVAALLAILVVRRIAARVREPLAAPAVRAEDGVEHAEDRVGVDEVVTPHDRPARTRWIVSAACAAFAVAVLTAVVVVDQHTYRSQLAHLTTAVRDDSGANRAEARAGYARYTSDRDGYAVSVPTAWRSPQISKETVEKMPMRFIASEPRGNTAVAVAIVPAPLDRELATETVSEMYPGEQHVENVDLATGPAWRFTVVTLVDVGGNHVKVNVRVYVLPRSSRTYLLMEAAAPEDVARTTDLFDHIADSLAIAEAGGPLESVGG